MPRLTIAAAVGAIALSITALTAAPAAAATVAGHRCTIVGTAHADHLVGTSRNDVICGLGGDDTISGGGGDDLLLGGSGNDRITGGSGNDRIDAGSGNDVVSGGTGNDTLDGGPGNDAITGGTGKDRISGSSGNDTIAAGDDADAVSGGTGSDRITGGNGADVLAGGSGDDRIDGGGDADRVDGGTGNDTLVGGTGNDVLLGDAGNDGLTPGPGVDKAYGDAGNDSFRIGDDDVNDTIDGGTGVTSCYYEKTGMETPACRPPLTKTYITAFTFSTQTIDTSASAQTVHVEAFAENDVADVKAIELYAFQPGGGSVVSRLTFSSGTARHGWWGADLVFPQYSSPGVYHLSAHTTDVNNKQETWGDIGPGYGSPFHGPSTITQTGAGDVSGPVLSDVTLDQRRVDTSAGAATVHVRARVTDDLLGTQSVSGYLYLTRYQKTMTLQRTSGSAMDGIWEGDLVLPRFTTPGSWTLTLNSSDGLHAGIWSPGDGSNTIEQIGAGDSLPPTASAISLPLDPIDTSQGPVILPVTMHLADDVSGVADAPTLRVMLPTRSVAQCTLQLRAGTSTSGDWGCDLTISQYATGGSYFFWLDLDDVAGNSVELTLKDLGSQTGVVHLVNAAP